MTTASPPVAAWADHPVGKVARVGIAVGGLTTATLVLMSSSMVTRGSWALVFLGVTLSALAVRAARFPTTLRLALTSVVLIGILLAYQAL